MGEDGTAKLEQSVTTPERFVSCGIERETEILRYTSPKGSRGIAFKYEGGVLTARHVVEEDTTSGFISTTSQDIDFAFKPDASCHGLPLGYVDKLSINDVEMVTSSLEDPRNLVVIPGSLEVYFLPTLLRPFRPQDPETVAPYLKPGASGSPLIYKNHIIGLVPWLNLKDPHELAAVVFTGATRQGLEKLGLSFEQIN